jgi:hypothetical protein
MGLAVADWLADLDRIFTALLESMARGEPASELPVIRLQETGHHSES